MIELLYSKLQEIQYDYRKRLFYRNLEKQNNILDESTRIGDSSIVHDSRFGRHSGCGQRCEIYGSYIGNFVSIAPDVKIGLRNHIYQNYMTHDFCYGGGEEVVKLPEGIEGFKDGYFVDIGNDVWIGANTIVFRNINIGDGAIIAAGSIVTKSVPPFAVVAGNPAKFIKWRFGKNEIDKLEEIQWWHLSDQEIADRSLEFSGLVNFDMTEYKSHIYKKKNYMDTL